MRPEFVRGHDRAALSSERGEHGRLAARSGAQIEPAFVASVEGGVRDCEGAQLAALVLHPGPVGAHGGEGTGIAAVEVHRVRRPPAGAAAGVGQQIVAGDLPGPRDQVGAGPLVVGCKRRGRLVEWPVERVAEGVGERGGYPLRVRGAQREASQRGLVAPELLGPGVPARTGHATQDGVDETRRAATAGRARQIDGGRDRGVRRDAGAQRLVRAEAKQVEHLGLDARKRSIDAFGEHPVERPDGADGAVARARSRMPRRDRSGRRRG